MRLLQNVATVLVLALLPRPQFAESFSAVPVRAQAQATPRWKSTVELTIGGATADDHATFGRLVGLAVDAAGRIFVADRQDNNVKIFSRDGAYVRTIGRKGAGPLEFTGLSGIAMGPGQLLWARDDGNGRFLAIDNSGTTPRVTKNLVLKDFSSGNRIPMFFNTAGSFLDEGIWFDKGIDSFRPLVLHRSAAGAVVRTDTVPVPAGANAGVQKVTIVQRDASGKETGIAQRYFSQPYGPKWVRAYGPNGLRAEVVTSRYEISIYDANGKLVRTIKRTETPVTLSATEKRRADSILTATKQKLSFGVPSAKAPILGIKFTQEGQLWVERAVPDGHASEADIFDVNGKFIAVAEWPRNTEITLDYRSVITGTTAYAISADADGLESIVRLKFR